MAALEWTNSPQYGRICGFVDDTVLFPRIKAGELWEPDLVVAFEHCIRPGSIAIDCGANIGPHSIAMVARQPKVARVFAFEPHPEIFQALAANVRDNPQINPFNSAVSNRTGTLLMRSIEGDTNPAGAIIAPTGDYCVKATTLDALRLRDVSLIKIDVEGFEMQVIEGAAGLIASQHPTLIVEMHPGRDRSRNIDRIRSLGYEAKELTSLDVLFAPFVKR